MPTNPDGSQPRIAPAGGPGRVAADGSGELYRRLCAYEVLRAAYARAREEVGGRPDGPRFAWPGGPHDLDSFLRQLSDDLSRGAYPSAALDSDPGRASGDRSGEADLRDLVVCAAARALLAPSAAHERTEWLSPRAAADRVAALVGGGLVRAYTVDLTRAYLAANLSRVTEMIRSRIDDPGVLALLDALAAGPVDQRSQFGPLFADLAYEGVEHVLRQAEAIGRTPSGGPLRWVRHGHELVVLADGDPAHEWILPSTQVRLHSELCTGLHYDAALLAGRTADLSRGGTLRLFGFELRATGHGRPRVRALAGGDGPPSRGRDRPPRPPERRPLGAAVGANLRCAVRAVARLPRRGFGLLVRGMGRLARAQRPNWVTATCGLVALVCLSAICWDVYAHSSGESPAPGQPPGFYLGQYNAGTVWRPEPVAYGLYLPPHLRNDDGPFPLIVFLHGYGERTPDAVFREGLPRSIATKLGAHARRGQSRFDFVAVFPVDTSGMWEPESYEATAAMKAVEYVIRRHRIDSARVYLTGMSNGAAGVWGLAETHPDVWAALAPVSSFREPDVPVVRHIPAWIFHGGNDQQAPIEAARSSAERLRAAKADVRFTEFPGLGHRIGYKVYDDKGVYEWFAAKKRPSR